MSSNLLLLWMSARKEGSWAQFRAAVEELRVGEGGDGADAKDGEETDQYALPVYQAVRLNLQRLGHAEFFAGAGDSEWRVTPPTLAISTQQSGTRGVVAGARSSRLLAGITELASNAHLQVLNMPEAPDAIRLSSDDEKSLAIAGMAAGLLIQRDAPAAILQSLPTIGDPTVRRPLSFPIGADWQIDRFNMDTLGWTSIARREAESATLGLFRFSFRHQRMVFWRSRGQSWAIPGQVGKYMALKKRKKHVIKYNAETNEVCIPAPCRPPFLIERGLIACSGMLPTNDSNANLLRYADVPVTIARLAAGLLLQELQQQQ